MPTRSEASLSPLEPTALAASLRTELDGAGSSPIVATPDEIEAIGSQRGAYLLVLRVPRRVELQSLKRPCRFAAPGSYVYAGSAYGPGGLAARLRRHMWPKKTMHWHIDKLTVKADAMAALAVPGGDECMLVEALLSGGRFRVAIPGFGSSDCRNCEGHLLGPLG